MTDRNSPLPATAGLAAGGRAPAVDATPGIADPAGELPFQDGTLQLEGDLSLFHGGSLAGVRLAWRIAGPAGTPVVAALGGISAHRRVYSTEARETGWWHEVAGPGQAFPADRLRVLSFDYLGGSGETTGPRDGQDFPSISSYDQAELLRRLLDHLGIRALRAIVGASYGGMVALAFGERHPDRVEQLVVVSASDRTHPMSTAWRSVQRRMVRFAIDCGRPKDGLQLARALAMSTYRSPEEFAARFSGAPRAAERGFVFPVEDYLMARGADYATRYQPDGFLCLSESIDLHRVDAGRIFVPVTAVAVREDQLVPVADMRAMVARLPHAKLQEISSLYGHDAFLKEADALRPIFAKLPGA
jgi:homoserine O-acetyltransferase